MRGALSLALALVVLKVFFPEVIELLVEIIIKLLEQLLQIANRQLG